MAEQHRVTFTIGLDDLTNGSHLMARRRIYVLAAGGAVVGLILLALGSQLEGVVILALSLLLLAIWRFPVADRWWFRRHASALIGNECEMWLDDTGVAYRQTGMEGHYAWEKINRIKEDDRTLLLMQGGIPLASIPKRAFASPQEQAAFVAAIRQASNIPDR